MVRINMKFYSKVLEKETAVNVVIPEKMYEGKYKCLYLLHGLGDDENKWLESTGIEMYAEKYGIAVVMPRAEESFYATMKHGEDYFTHIAIELPQYIRSIFNISDKREDNYIAGLSMGGYGAMKIGLRRCADFAAIGSLSPCGDIVNLDGFEGVLAPVFGEDRVVPEEDDLIRLAEKYKDDPDRPKVFLGIGLEDFLYQNTQPLCEKLRECGYDFTYRESHGMHNWAFWDEYIQYVLEWMLA